jgi:chromosome partitioning protein
MKIIAAVAEKGGVGKTAIACIVAAGLRLAGARVLMVVMDIQIGGAAAFLRNQPPVSGTAALLLGEAVAPDVGHLGIAVLSGGPALDGGDIRSLRSDELRFALLRLADHYDAVVIDVAPVILHLHRLALEAADLALVITDALSTESMDSMTKLIGEIETARERRATVPELVVPVINKMTRAHALDRHLADQIVRRYGATHTILEIPHTTIIPKAIALRQPELALTAVSPACRPLQELVVLAGQLIVRSEC